MSLLLEIVYIIVPRMYFIVLGIPSRNEAIN